MVRVESLAFSYGTHPLLHDLSFSVAERSSYAILGTTGCGKSTLLHLLAGLHRPDHGSITIAGEECRTIRDQTALILQDGGLMPWKTIAENVSLGLEVRGIARSEARARARTTLETLGIDHRARAYPSGVSGGERQRAALARALVLEPDLLLLDEASAALDAITRERIQDLLLAIFRERHLTMVLVTHSIEEAVALGERIAVLCDGRIASEQENTAFSPHPDRFSAQFAERCRLVRNALVAGATTDADARDERGNAP
ncbi:MAG: ABC transporter ATP-binding protein [Spirochaetota bacterium]